MSMSKSHDTTVDRPFCLCYEVYEELHQTTGRIREHAPIVGMR